MNRRVEDYWANQCLESGILGELTSATHLERVDCEQHCDPPDALYCGFDVHGARLQLWVEISGASRSRIEARETFEVAEGKRPVPTGRHGLLGDPDKATARSVLCAIQSKLQKTSYRDLVCKYGPGHLHITVSSDHYPLFDTDTLADVCRYAAMAGLEDQIIFRSVSVGWRGRVFPVWNRSGMPTVGTRNVLSGLRKRIVCLRTGKLSSHIPSEPYDLPLLAVGIAAARETVLTATPHMASIWTDLLSSFLLPSDYRLVWRQNGPGVGRDARIAYSSLLGRYVARAYLTEEQGVRCLVPVDVAKRALKDTRFAIEKRPRRGLEADWIGFDQCGLVIVEAKGSFDEGKATWRGPHSLPSTVTTAYAQAQRTILVDRNTGKPFRAKRWAVASRWGTEEKKREPTVIAVYANGCSQLDEAEWNDDEEAYSELASLLLRAEVGCVKGGLTMSTVGALDSSREAAPDVQRPFAIRIGGRSLGPCYSAAFGPFGQGPLRNRDDLEMVRRGAKIGTPIAVASLSARYYQHVMDVRFPHLVADRGETWFEDDKNRYSGEREHENPRSPEIRLHGLAVTWMHPDEDIAFGSLG